MMHFNINIQTLKIYQVARGVYTHEYNSIKFKTAAG